MIQIQQYDSHQIYTKLTISKAQLHVRSVDVNLTTCMSMVRVSRRNNC